MARKFYAPSTGGFYIEGVSPTVPDDAVFVDDSLYSSLLGRQIEPGEDGLPQEAPATGPQAPRSVTMRQARLALHAAGRLQAVNAAIEAAGVEAAIEWEFAATVERDSALLAALVPAIGMTEEDLDQLFTLAATL